MRPGHPKDTTLGHMRVEFLYWAGCPSHPQALADLRDAMSEGGLDPESVLVREVSSEEEAEREAFIGSPTIRLDGADIASTEGEAFGLNCRIYSRRDGRISPTPDPQDLRDAIARACETLTAASPADQHRHEETR